MSGEFDGARIPRDPDRNDVTPHTSASLESRPPAEAGEAVVENHGSGPEPAPVDREPVIDDVPKPTTLAAKVLSLPIVAYRRWVSPALPARCRFYPSCSAYALTAIARHGPVRGIGLAIWRLLRCHPFHPGGFDPVPPPRAHRDDVTGAVTR
jgi:putative membrane protein insertion efficiency factor